MSDDRSLDPEAAAAIRRVRRLMLIAGATTFIALAFVLGVIGYRLYHIGEGIPAQPAAVAASLPAGARVLSTTVGGNRIVLTIEVAGAVELRTFDLDTLRPLGRVGLNPSP